MIFICSNTNYASLDDLANAISARKNLVTNLVWFSEEQYRKLAAGGRFQVIWLRVGMYILYPVWLISKVLFAPSGSTFVVTTNTFFAPGLVQMMAGIRRHKVIHLLYDLFPDAMEVAGKFKLNSLRSRIIAQVTKATIKHCAHTVYLGEFLRQHAETRWMKNNRSAVIDVGVDVERFPKFNIQVGTKQILKIRYGGQLGYMHEAELLASCCDAAVHALSGKIEFHFFASGTGVKHIKSLGLKAGIVINEPRYDPHWRESFNQFPIGLVSLSPGGATVCLPSKVYGMLAGSQAIMAICPEWSDLGRILISHRAGWVVNNSIYHSINSLDSNGYLHNIRKSRDNKQIVDAFVAELARIQENLAEIADHRTNARKAAEQYYGLPALSSKWSEVISE